MDIRNILMRLQAAGMTQAEIGAAIGCTQPTVSEMASGKVGTVRPSWKIVQGLTQLAEKRGLRREQQKNSPRRRSTDKNQ
jgi:predicted XRE-type DNA-binding protein